MTIIPFNPNTNPGTIERVTACALRPVVDRISGNPRQALRNANDLDRPAIYLATFDRDHVTQVYVGMSSCVRDRLAGEHVAGASQVLVISDAEHRLSREDLMVLERAVHGWLEKLRGYMTMNGLSPNAEAVGPARFGELQLFLASALALIQQQGWLFTEISARGLQIPPKAFDELASFHRHRFVAGGEEIEIAKAGVTARAQWLGDGVGLFLLPGGQVRREVVSSGPKILAARREELLYQGHLALDENGDYRVIYPLRFATLTAAGEFVTGASAGPEHWRIVDDPSPRPPVSHF